MIMTKPESERLDSESQRLLAIHEKGLHTALLAEVDELSKRGPLTPGILGIASASLAALDRFDEAVKTAQAALEQEPRQAWLHLALSRGEAGRKDWTRATEAARAAVQLMPGQPFYLAHLAECQRQSGRPDLAIRSAQQALTVDPGHVESLNALGLALEAQGDRTGALEQFRRAQAARPADPSGFLLEGRLHLGAGAVSDARRAFRGALQQNPGLEEAENLLVESLGGGKPLQATVLHLLNLSRLTVVGWAIAAFLYYLFFRLLEWVWHYFPITLPVGRFLLVVSLVWLVGGALVGRLLRLALRAGWPK